MDLMYRADHIKNCLDRHFLDEINVAVATPEPTWWWNNVAIFGRLGPLGFGPPVSNPEHKPGGDTPMIVAYCPEIIDEQTQDLTDEELDAYLELIHFILDLHLVTWDEPDQDVRHDGIEAMLAEHYPDFHNVLQIQHALVEFRKEIEEGT